MRATPVIMVHGAFCGGWAFEKFEKPFLAAGHPVLRPDLRGHEAGAPAQAVANLSMSDYVADIADLCAGLPEPPVLIGHSMGGLVAQLVAARTPVRALALLAPSAPWGVVVSSLEEAVAAFGVQFMGPFWMGAAPPDRAMMLSYGLNRAAPRVRDAVLARLRHESGRAISQTLNWWFDPQMTTSLPPGPLPAPCLALVGDRDRIHAPASVRQTARRIGAQFELLPDLGHWLVAEPGCEDVARRVLDWLALEVSAAV